MISVICSIIAFASLIRKDRSEYFGLGKPTPINFKDYWDILKNNRAMQMLVVSASTDKLATQTKGDATVTLIIYAIVCGNAAASGLVSSYTTIPNVLFIMFGAGLIAAKLGQKRSIQIGSAGWSLFTVLFMGLTVAFNGFNQIAGSVVITMTADVADYEVYRSGKYVPGMIGTLFSFVDKLISSLATTIVGLMCAAIGFTQALPTAETPYSTGLLVVGLIAMYGMVLFGLTCNLIAMKFYPLSKEKMAEIQDEIAAIKARNAA